MAINGKIIYLGRSSLSTPVNLDTFVSGANKIIGARVILVMASFLPLLNSLLLGDLDLKKWLPHDTRLKEL